MLRSIITGTGSYIPTKVKTNQDFTVQQFYLEDGELIKIEPHLIIEKFKK